MMYKTESHISKSRSIFLLKYLDCYDNIYYITCLPVLCSECFSLRVKVTINYSDEIMLTQGSLSQSHGSNCRWLRNYKTVTILFKDNFKIPQIKSNKKEGLIIIPSFLLETTVTLNYFLIRTLGI